MRFILKCSRKPQAASRKRQAKSYTAAQNDSSFPRRRESIDQWPCPVMDFRRRGSDNLDTGAAVAFSLQLEARSCRLRLVAHDENLMPFKHSEFDLKDVDVVEEETLFQGFSRLLRKRLRHRLFEGSWGPVIERELFDRGDACAAILYDPRHDLVGLVEQFRVGALKSEYGPWCLELVAGVIDPGETPDQVVRREVAEETGIREVELHFITAYYTTPGACNEKVYLYYGLCDLSQAGGTYGLAHEHEDIRLHILSADEVFAAMLDSRLNNASTLIGLQWLQSHRAKLRAAGSV